MDKKVVNRISEILEPTEEQRERMFSNILERHRNESAQKRDFTPMKRLKPALAAVMVFCLITTTAFAASYWGLDIKFLNFLNPSSDEQAEYLANGAYVVDKQVKNKNGTLNIKQVIGDSNVTFILMDFTAPEGTVLDKAHYSFEDMYIDMDAYSGFYGYGIISLKDENSNDNKISMVMPIKTDESLMGQKAHLGFTDLIGSDTKPGEFTTAVSGEWKASFKLDFRNLSTDYQVDKPIKMVDYDATIKTISISPISVTLKIGGPFMKEIINEYNNSYSGFDSDQYPITINYKDGSSETTTRIFNGLISAEDDLVVIKNFENIINDKEIKSITFFDTEIPIINK